MRQKLHRSECKHADGLKEKGGIVVYEAQTYPGGYVLMASREQQIPSLLSVRAVERGEAVLALQVCQFRR